MTITFRFALKQCKFPYRTLPFHVGCSHVPSGIVVITPKVEGILANLVKASGDAGKVVGTGPTDPTASGSAVAAPADSLKRPGPLAAIKQAFAGEPRRLGGDGAASAGVSQGKGAEGVNTESKEKEAPKEAELDAEEMKELEKEAFKAEGATGGKK